MTITQYLSLRDKGVTNYTEVSQTWEWEDISGLVAWSTTLKLPELLALVEQRVHHLVKIELETKRQLTAGMVKLVQPFLMRQYSNEDREADRLYKERRKRLV
jgi:hypothetical protein